MLLRLHRPGPPLDRFVELITYYEGLEVDHRREKLLPDGAVELIVDLTDEPKKLWDREDLTRYVEFRGAWLSGMRRKWLVIEAAPGAAMAVIRFRPGGALPFLGFAVESVTDLVEPLEDVLGRASLSLRDRILEAPTLDSKLRAVEGWLLERGRGRMEPNPVIEYLTGRLFAPAGIRISDVIEEVGYSQRHVLAMFRRAVGLAPKQYGRIRRFQQVLEHLARASGPRDVTSDLTLRSARLSEPDWADIAVAHGYYDQSHLVRDFREFAGLTPGAYVAAYRGLENYLPLD